MVGISYYRIVRPVFISVPLLVLLVGIAVLRVGGENVTMKSRSIASGMATGTTGTTAVKTVMHRIKSCLLHAIR